ncbi:MAG: CaiB/BaiF CoA transferase family protein, partial [Salinirussus sp.]
NDRPGFGTLAEAMSGFVHVNGYPDREPLLPPTGLADGIAGVFGALGVLAALIGRPHAEAGGQYIDTSLLEPIFTLLGPHSLEYQHLEKVPERTGNRSTSSAPRNIYETGDGQYVAIAASVQELAMRVFEAIGRPELQDDPRFEDNESRLENVEILDEIIQDWMAQHSRREIIQRFEDAEATIGPIYDIEDIIDDEHYRARNALVEVPDDALGSGIVHNVFPRLNRTPGRISHLGPELGSHNKEVYRDWLEYDVKTVNELREAGVI